VRLDRWLWAARFFKTRAQAKAAVEGGKVHLLPTSALKAAPGQASAGSSQAYKPKVSKAINVGDLLSIRRGWSVQTVRVTGLSEQRGNATAAAGLYAETEASIEAREAERSRRRMESAGLKVPESRPTKRDRRALQRLKETPGESS
jgi:ribosome-associated heat shock protein Hsp15